MRRELTMAGPFLYSEIIRGNRVIERGKESENHIFRFH